MKHEMKLNHRPFCLIRSGIKTIEMRLCDRKRAAIEIGDIIEFSHRENGEKLLTRVVNLTKFKNFIELYSHFDKSILGYRYNEEAKPEDMSRYYSEKEINDYGALAIEIELI